MVSTNNHEPPRSPIPKQVGRYLIREPLGSGAMGSVYLAYDPELDRELAIKLLHPVSRSGDGSKRDTVRLRREARALAKLSHPNVIEVYDVGTLEQEGETAVFLAMAYIDGCTLRAWLDQEPREPVQVLHLLIQAGWGLAAAHDAGMLHRDVKPENILVDRRNRPVLVDFGLARTMIDSARRSPEHSEDPLAETMVIRAVHLDDETRTVVDPLAHPFDADLTATGTLVGSPAYMSTERLMGLEADARSDQYSFCVTLFEALFGERPYAGQNLEQLVSHITHGNRNEPAAFDQAPAFLQKALLRGLDPDPEVRWPSMHTLLGALERGAAYHGRALSDPRPPARHSRSQPLAVLALLIVSSLLIFGFGLRVLERDEPCQKGQIHLAPIWNSERRHQISDTLLDTRAAVTADTAERVDTLLADYAELWIREHDATCEELRQGRISDPIHHLRMACLFERRAKLDTLLEQLEESDPAAVHNAISAVYELESPESCASSSTLDAIRSRNSSIGTTPELVESPFPPDHRARSLVEQGAIAAIDRLVLLFLEAESGLLEADPDPAETPPASVGGLLGQEVEHAAQGAGIEEELEMAAGDQEGVGGEGTALGR